MSGRLRESKGQSRNRRPTVGFLLASIHKGSSGFLWPGVVEEAARTDTNLFCFPGGALNAEDDYEIQRNAVYRLVSPEFLDGIVSWASSLGGAVDAEAITAFHEQFLAMPLVTLSYPLPGVPTVMVDAYQGMQDLLSHLIEAHDYRSIAFIRGPKTHVTANERFQAYLDLLSRYGIQRREELICDPLAWDGGEAAVRQLIDERGLCPGRDFRALVAASDLQIFGAAKSLQRRGFRIPEDIAVAGFNDITESRLLSPLITTVAIPFREQGIQAYRLLLSMLRHREVKKSVSLPTRLIVRESCGCPSECILLAAAKAGRHKDGPAQKCLGELVEQMCDEAAAILHEGADIRTAWLIPLVKAFIDEVQSGSSADFLRVLHNIMERVIHGEGAISPWQDVISSLRRRALAVPDGGGIARLEDLCSQARVLISEAVDRSRTLREWRSRQTDQQLRDLGKQLLMTLDFDRLGNVLRENLPRLGIPSAYVCLYEDSWDHPEYARLIVGFTEAGWVIDRSDPPVFPLREIISPQFLPPSRRYSYVVLPLFHQDQPLGYAVLEVRHAEGTLYEELRTYLSSALKGALLFDQARQARAAAEKADQLKSRLLANISHELRTPLTTILRHVSAALRRYRDGAVELPHDLREDFYHIQRNAEHQLRVTNDLIDLSRAQIEQLDLAVSVIDPRPLLTEVFEELAGSGMSAACVRWEKDFPPRLPYLMADEARLGQILRNLLENAAKLTKHGSILLAAEVEPPYLHITVRDSGPGMSDRQQERIFEPFVNIGSDPERRHGIGLGLFLVRHLVALHSGRLDLESSPGRGSNFHVRLPLPNLSGPLLPYPENPAPVILVVSRADRPAEEIQRLAQRCGRALKRLHSDTDWEDELGGLSPAALVWDMERASPGDWALIRSLRHHPLLFEAPFLLYGRIAERDGSAAAGAAGAAGGARRGSPLKAAESGTLFEIINSVCPAPSTGPVFILSEDFEFRKLFARVVEKGLEGFSLRCLTDCEEALTLMQQEPPALVIMDFQTGKVSGTDLVSRLRCSAHLQSVPVLLLSGGVLSPENIADLENQARVTLLNNGILSASETLELVNRMLFSEKWGAPYTVALVNRAVGYLNQNYGRAITRWKLAEAVNASEDYLTRVFSRELGISPWEYLNRFRVRQARMLLCRSEESIHAIAEECGFRDQAYFCRVFRKITAVSPLEYRKNAHRDSSF